MVHGKFENIKGAYFALADWLQKHNLYKMTGKNRQIVHRGPWNEANPDNYLTEIQIPLKQTA
jgi:effector-binding domain-containing protein